MKIKKSGANVTELELSDGTIVLFSYQTPVAACISGRGFVRSSEHYSATTSRHVNHWLDGRKHESVDQAVLDALVVAP